MTTSEGGQLARGAAEKYEEIFVPSLFKPWVERVMDAARIQLGQRVLDVACGTGVLARSVAERVGPRGSVVGVDPNEGMLSVANRIAPGIEWQEGRAEDLPFDDQSFDAVVSQFGMMFFGEQRAVREMTRVLRPSGRLAVAVWGRLEDSEAYATFIDLVQRKIGTQAADELRASFVLGDRELLRSLFADSDLADVEITTEEGAARFASVRTLVRADVEGWTLGEMIDQAQIDELVQELEQVLQSFVNAEGALVFPIQAHIVSANKG